MISVFIFLYSLRRPLQTKIHPQNQKQRRTQIDRNEVAQPNNNAKNIHNAKLSCTHTHRNKFVPL